MPSKDAKARKWAKKKKAQWCKTYGRTAKQLENYEKRHGKGSVPAPPN